MPSARRSRLQMFTLKMRDYVMASIGASAALIAIGLIMIANNNQIPLAYRSAGITAAWIPLTVKHWDKPINEMAKKYDIDANLVAILLTMESGGDSQARSGVGALGLMQVTPPTAQDIAAKHLKQPVTKYDLMDPRTNIEFGVAYLAWLRDEFGTAAPADPSYLQTVELIAAGYNGGAGTASALDKGEGLRDIQPVAYSRDAYNMWRERAASTSPTFERWRDRGGSALIEAAKQRQEHK